MLRNYHSLHHPNAGSKSLKHALRPSCARLSGRMAVGAAALLLSACGITNGFLSGEQADNSIESAAAVQGGKRTRAGNRDNGTEWSTAKGNRSLSRGKRASSLDELLAEPEYSVSIKEIMANATCRECEQRPYHQMVVNASNRHGVPTSLIHAVIQKESAYKPAATSHRRARGLMQLTPETARFVGVSNGRQLYDPQTNIYAGTAYLKYLLASHDTVDEALAAYNSGPGNVRKYKGVPPFKETKRYVRDVKKFYVTTSQ
jgi:soluble lytic murein transglycosylase-like protein